MTEPENLEVLQSAFNDPRLPELLFRYRARNWPETLSKAEFSQWRDFCQSRWQDSDGQVGINLKSFGQQLAEMSIDPELDESQRAIVDALLDWPVEIEKQLAEK